jgi:NTP pyrophosphatase (non-canonical NTP hydrolase)
VIEQQGKAGRIAAGRSAADQERRSHALDAIDIERNRQDYKWGEQNHPNLFWLSILAEEFGEIGKSINEKDFCNMKSEIVQTAAVCVAWLECLERNNRNGTSR